MPLWFRAWEQGGQAKIALRVDTTKALLELSRQGMTPSAAATVCMGCYMLCHSFAACTEQKLCCCSSIGEAAILRGRGRGENADRRRLQHRRRHRPCSSLPNQSDHRPTVSPVMHRCGG